MRITGEATLRKSFLKLRTNLFVFASGSSVVRTFVFEQFLFHNEHCQEAHFFARLLSFSGSNLTT